MQQEEQKTSRVRFDRLREIEKSMQAVWAANPEKYTFKQAPEGYHAMSLEEKNNSKYMVTFPYPYMNGYLHLGHAFSMSKAEFQARYQRQRGRNAIFPFGFHCTGMPIQAAANRLTREIDTGKTRSEQPKVEEKPVEEKPAEKAPEAKGGKKGKAKGGDKKDAKAEVPRVPPTQYEILMQVGISEADIPAFKDPEHWLRFFPPQGKKDLIDFGISADWRRSFITTSINPFYDSFIQWQVNSLKASDKIFYGKKYTIFSELDGNPCADHDRSKGEGVAPQEYVGIKIKLLEFPESIQQFAGKDVFLVAATLRPETMYGQTNCFVLPSAEYGVYEMKNNEFFIISERAARNFAFQEMTKVDKEFPCLAKVSGQDLIGKALKAPLTKYEKVYALPMATISMTKGTGIVTSVPSDSPDDWATLRDLQTKAGLREKFNVDEAWVKDFAPLEIINIPEFGNLTAVHLVDELKIASQNDKDLLKKAKDKAYLKGFYEGKMITGLAEGESVENAKPIIKKHLLAEGMACPYYEPESEVVSRTGDTCIVATCYQWFFRYGEEQWRDFIMDHVKSENFKAYNKKTQGEFEMVINWLKEWGCTRTQGLGTTLPWDTQFKIESLSDSTIYMAYYTVAHLLQGGDINGASLGPLGIKPEDLSHGVWEYIFRKGEYPENCAISQENLDKMRYEFEYWYPMDMRVSGKDLIRNHLTMSLYNHAGIWEDTKMMPQSMYCNGYMVLNNEKMSKSSGNFLTVRDCINRFGVDATRITLADAGDGLDDANFDTDVANAVILKLSTLEQWIKENIKKAFDSNFAADSTEYDLQEFKKLDLWDSIFENAINHAIINATQNYDDIKYKNVLKYGFFEMLSIKEDYLIAKAHKANPVVMMRYITAQLTIINPIVPHFAQYIWKEYVFPTLNKCKNADGACREDLDDMPWPTPSAEHDKIATERLAYLKDVKGSIRLGLEKAKTPGGKKGKKAAPAEPPAPIEKCNILVAKEYPEFQKKCLQILQTFEFDEDNKIQGEYIQVIREAFDKKQAGLAMKFVAFQLDIAKSSGKEAALRLEASFDEVECIKSNQAFLFENLHTIKEVNVLLNTSEEAQAIGTPQAREAAAPSKPAVFFS